MHLQHVKYISEKTQTLFKHTSHHNNLLPYDGVAIYQSHLFDEITSQYYFTELCSTVDWQHEVIKMFGREIVVAERKVALYGEAGLTYMYSGIEKKASEWTTELHKLKEKVVAFTELPFNSCLLNFYPNGLSEMGWHSDNEHCLGKHVSIASISFGATRRFMFKHKTTQTKVAIQLENGSLLTMLPPTQKYWLHALPKSRKVTKPRMNLTFRQVITKTT